MKGYTTNIEKLVASSDDFRRVIYTARSSQLVIMSLRPGEEIGNEVHDVDQFFRFESGQGKAVLNNSEQHIVGDGSVLIVPAGTWHNIINTSKTAALKLYTLYCPPHHRDGVVHKTRAEGEADATDEFKGVTTE